MPLHSRGRGRGRGLRPPSAPQEWTRRRLQILLALGACSTAVLVGCAIWYVVHTLRADEQETPAGMDLRIERPVSDEDRLANRPLPQAAPEDAQPGPLTTETASRISLPRATGLGAVQVPTGFPRTPEGAMAQLIAIDRAALESASIYRAQEVIENWAARGGPTAQNWSGVAAVATFLSAGGFLADGAPEVSLVAEPSMGLIKGAIGDAFVVPCVDFVLTVTAGPTSRVAAADCQRMVWVRDRWLIGPGPEPAPAPSVWPGTQASLDAGYQWLEVAP